MVVKVIVHPDLNEYHQLLFLFSFESIDPLLGGVIYVWFLGGYGMGGVLLLIASEKSERNQLEKS